MSKSDSFTLVLTVICLSVLMSEAQSTTDETNSCSSSSLDEVVNLVKLNALKLEEMKEKQEQNAQKIDNIASMSCESETAVPSKQTLVSALVSECRISTQQHTVQKNHF